MELSELGRTVSTADMKRLFHESLLQSTVNSEALTAQGSAQQADYAKLKLGSFDVDPKFTDFVGKSDFELSDFELKLLLTLPVGL